VRDPAETWQEGQEAADRRPPSKALLREMEFLRLRGLGDEPDRLSPDLSSRLQTARSRSVSGVTGTPSPYVLGNDQKESLRAAAPPDDRLKWRSLGPAGIPSGQTYGDGTTTVSGRVGAIAVDPRDSAHILVGSAAGGVWETRDTGQTWIPRTDKMPTLSIGALAFDPDEPSIVYAGTGEGNWAYRRLGQGIFKSQDGGSSWEHIQSPAFLGHGFYRIVVDPRQGQRLIAATTNGAFVSDDGGQTWQVLHRRLTWDVSLAYQGDERELLIAAADGLLAATGTKPPAVVALVNLARPGRFADLSQVLDPARERLAVTHLPADPGQVFAFAAARGRAFLWRRAAAGELFESVPLASFPSVAIPPGPASQLDDVLDVGQASYDWFVAAPPEAPDVVYLGSKELVRGRRDGGEWHWSDVSSRPGGGDSIHPDQHVLAFDVRMPGVIYAGNDGGIFRSPDAGDSWQPLNAGLAISEVEYIAQRPADPDWILAGLQDNGTVRTRTGGGSWEQVAKGDGGDCAVNAENPDVCYHTNYYISLSRSDRGGDPDPPPPARPFWQRVTPPNTGLDRFQQLFYPPLEVNGDVVAIGGEVVCITSDAGVTWAQVPLPPIAGRPSTASALAVPAKDRIFAGTVLGDIFEIDRGGWGGVPALLTRPLAGNVSDLLIDLRSTPHLYWATYSTIPGSVFLSVDGGAHWIDRSGDLPTSPVNAIVADPSNPNRFWVACDLGVYKSQDAGGHWSLFGVDLPNALAVDLLFHEPSRRLRVATRSRGLWEVVVPPTSTPTT
jgi:photosystem II stability/assembly factor-like uncharacterized protein